LSLAPRRSRTLNWGRRLTQEPLFCIPTQTEGNFREYLPPLMLPEARRHRHQTERPFANIGGPGASIGSLVPATSHSASGRRTETSPVRAATHTDSDRRAEATILGIWQDCLRPEPAYTIKMKAVYPRSRRTPGETFRKNLVQLDSSYLASRIRGRHLNQGWLIANASTGVGGRFSGTCRKLSRSTSTKLANGSVVLRHCPISPSYTWAAYRKIAETATPPGM